MYIITVAVIALCAGVVFGQSSPCLSADGRRKPCIPFPQCEQLRTLAKKSDRTVEDINLLLRSFCGSKANVAHVCCPEPQNDQKIISPPQCKTPDGKPGECVNVLSCQHIANMLRPPVTQETVAFVKSSRCLGSEKHSVCCGPPPAIPRTTTPPEFGSLEDPGEPDECQALMTAFPPDRSSECCGYSVGVGNKIKGGEPTGIDEYPWAVVIEYSLNDGQGMAVACGGALISGKYVLTAAHCIAGRILKTVTPRIVRLGEYDIINEGQDCVHAPGGGLDCTEGVKRIKIEKTIPHPNYIYGKSKRHDIGLIRMRETAPYTDFIRPICLPLKDLTRPENTPPYFSMYAVGWGATENSTYSNVKLDVNVPFVSLDKCQRFYKKAGRDVTLVDGQLCAGGIENKDSCKGDSGGPLVYENEEQFDLIGIVSFGPDPCGEKGTPAIYSNVYQYLDWIKSVIVA